MADTLRNSLKLCAGVPLNIRMRSATSSTFSAVYHNTLRIFVCTEKFNAFHVPVVSTKVGVVNLQLASNFCKPPLSFLYSSDLILNNQCLHIVSFYSHCKYVDANLLNIIMVTTFFQHTGINNIYSASPFVFHFPSSLFPFPFSFFTFPLPLFCNWRSPIRSG